MFDIQQIPCDFGACTTMLDMSSYYIVTKGEKPHYHKWELPVLCYHWIRANYPYPFLGVFLKGILLDFINKITIKKVQLLPLFLFTVNYHNLILITIFYISENVQNFLFPKHYPINDRKRVTLCNCRNRISHRITFSDY